MIIEVVGLENSSEQQELVILLKKPTKKKITQVFGKNNIFVTFRLDLKINK